MLKNGQDKINLVNIAIRYAVSGLE